MLLLLHLVAASLLVISLLTTQFVAGEASRGAAASVPSSWSCSPLPRALLHVKVRRQQASGGAVLPVLADRLLHADASRSPLSLRHPPAGPPVPPPVQCLAGMQYVHALGLY